MSENKDISKAIAENFNYVDEAHLTLSESWFGDYLNKAKFVLTIKRAVEALEELDRVKKALFYGKGILDENNCPNLPPFEIAERATKLVNGKQKELITHGIIGKATEAGELLELLLSYLIEDKELDVANLREEVGDGFWYDAILAKTAGFTFEQAQLVNIAKLRARFPNKFTEYDANNRDLKKERKILEKGLGCACEPSGEDGLKCPDSNGKPICCQFGELTEQIFDPNC